MRTTNRTIRAVLPILLLAGSPALAQDGPITFFGVGYDDVNKKHSGSAAVMAEYASASFGWTDGFRWRAAAQASGDADLWVGVGASYEFGLGASPWYLELGFVPGLYRRGNADRGEEVWHFPQFRSSVALGHRLGNGRDIALVVQHSSNGKLDGDGSSTEAVILRYGLSF